MTPAIAVTDVTKAYGSLVAVRHAGLVVEPGTLVALLGPSGSGKTTLLRMVAGFERPDRGEIRIGSRTVAGPGAWVEPEARRIGMVFQQGALFPHLDVDANVGFGAAAPDRAREMLALVGLAHRGTAFPHELSGGERQRVALARALAADPEVILLDEPFAALDAALRERLREEVAAILRAAGATALLVTHDQAEALSLADTVAVMRDGRIEQVGTPEEVYSQPATRWIAEFLGDADAVPGTVADGVVATALGPLPARDGLAGLVEVLVRPEAVALGADDGTAPGGVVVERTFYGHDHLVTVELDGGLRVRSRRLGGGGWRPGDRVAVRVEGAVGVVPAQWSGATAR